MIGLAYGLAYRAHLDVSPSENKWPAWWLRNDFGIIDRKTTRKARWKRYRGSPDIIKIWDRLIVSERYYQLCDACSVELACVRESAQSAE